MADGTYHAGCGGLILSGGHEWPSSGGANVPTAYHYCERCRAFRYDDDDVEAFPSGTDKKANRAAWDDGTKARSPDAP